MLQKLFFRSVKQGLTLLDLSKIHWARRTLDVLLAAPPSVCKYMYGCSVTSLDLNVRLRAETILPKDSKENENVILYFHGGGYLVGSPAMYRSFLCELASVTNAQIVSPDYRLAPEWKYPAQIADFVTSLKRCNELLKPKNLFIAGDSAGGHLIVTSLLAINNPELFEEEILSRKEIMHLPDRELTYMSEEIKDLRSEMPKIRGAILISPWLDLSISGTELTSRAVTVNESLMPVHLHEILGRKALGLTKKWDRDLSSPFISPANISSKHLPDVTRFPDILIHAGACDSIMPDMLRFEQNFMKVVADAPQNQTKTPAVTVRVWEGVPHVFQVFPWMKARWESYTGIADFIKRRSE